jgi:hypothetical protein
MVLTDLFHALNLAGVRLANVGGKLQLRPAGAVTAEIKTAALAHKAELLALLPPAPEVDEEGAAERQAIQSGPATADAEALAFPFGWDDAEAEALVARAREARDRHAADGQLESLERIDAAWEARDLAGLRLEVEEYLRKLEKSKPAEPKPGGSAFQDEDGFHWHQTATGIVREDFRDYAPVWVLPPGSSSPPIDGSCPGCDFCRPNSPNDA